MLQSRLQCSFSTTLVLGVKFRWVHGVMHEQSPFSITGRVRPSFTFYINLSSFLQLKHQIQPAYPTKGAYDEPNGG